ncbi:hypothetical protein HK405_002009 [Cladochytrium tenue]|nr:hypothetical protein HK405_002009 [Cladochytrium tenue]
MSAASLAEWVDAVPPRRLALLAAVGGALVGALAVLAASAAARRRSVRAFKARAAAVTSVGDNANTAVSTPGVLPPRPHVPEEFVREQLARNYAFLGEESMAKVRGAFVVVVGVGGVGSHAAHMLARSGVQVSYWTNPILQRAVYANLIMPLQRLRLVDFDQVTLSSLNRHAVAKLEDVGTPKVACIARRLKEVAPNLVIEMETALFDMAAASRLLAGKPDFVLDCIDNIETKADLIDYCVKNGIRVLASMGAGAKADPSRIQIADISETFEDPLARVTRRGLRLRGIEKGVPVVYSIEKPNSVKLLPLDEAKVDDAHEFSVLPNFRSRYLLGTLPALFGCTMASFVVTELAGFPLEPLPVKLRHKTYDRVYKDLKNESKESPEGVEGGKDEMKLSLGDIGFLLDEVELDGKLKST